MPASRATGAMRARAGGGSRAGRSRDEIVELADVHGAQRVVEAFLEFVCSEGAGGARGVQPLRHAVAVGVTSANGCGSHARARWSCWTSSRSVVQPWRWVATSSG